MPELPEVEVLRCSLVPHLVGARIASVSVHSPALREPIARRQLVARLRGRRVERLRRRAKYLWVDVENDATLAIHLGMSGRLTLTAPNAPLQPHEHVSFLLDSGRKLSFCDPRRFGLVLALATSRLKSDRHFAHLGVEPLTAGFDGDRLRQLATGRRGPVKNFLMDARVVVGVGNIYACEALHRAGIHPTRSVARIARSRWTKLAAAVKAVLEEAIGEGGTTINDFANGEGEAGYFQVSLAVYGRGGEPCKRCGATILRRVLAGRSTYYCPRCQS